MTTLISFLGKGQDGRGYRPANYRFEDSMLAEGQKYLGLTIAQKVQPSRVILLGTSGSMWDVFLESEADHLTTEWLELADCVKQQTVNSLQLRPFESYLQHKMNAEVHCELIPYARDTTEQFEILSRLAELLYDGEEVILDVTHGFRHLPMLALVAARFLKKTKNIKINQIYYGAFDMSQDNITPVLDLSGLLELLDWVDALSCFDKDGDFGIFTELLEKQGLATSHVELLNKASFFERTTNSSQAKETLSGVFKHIEQLNTPLFNLFKAQLIQRISWFKENSRGKREMSLARNYLQRKDYIRAIIYGFEGLISVHLNKKLQDENDFSLRDKAKDELRDNKSFNRLNRLRNAIAHGVKASDQDVLKVVRDEKTLKQSLEERFKHLLD